MAGWICLFEYLSATPVEPGAKSKTIFIIGKRETELIKTITVKKLPQEFSTIYEAKSMVKTMTNRLTSPEPNKTRWDGEIEYTRFNGILLKLMAFLMMGMFKKQTQKWQDQFKAFAQKKEI